MTYPIQIVFRNMERSQKLEQLINEKAEKLERVFDRISRMRVTVEIPHTRHKHGNKYQVSIDLSVPEKDIVVCQDTNGDHTTAESVYKVTKEAFEACKRQLEDYARKRRGEIKTPAASMPSAKVSQMFDDYGFLETFDGREVYFHSNSVVNDRFEKLCVGTEVSFVERMGDEGPKASTVKVKAKVV